jgi:hypothetical protein
MKHASAGIQLVFAVTDRFNACRHETLDVYAHILSIREKQ